MIAAFLCLVAWLAAAPVHAGGMIPHHEYFSYEEILLNYCDTLPGKTFAEVIKEVPMPEQMLYLCDQAGILHAVKGEVKELDAPPNFNGKSSFEGVPFNFRDGAEAREDAVKTETYDIWFSSQTHFGMRIANYTKNPISKIVVGLKDGDCVPPGQYFYEKLMMITAPPIPPGKERLVKWKRPDDLKLGNLSCMDIIRVSAE